MPYVSVDILKNGDPVRVYYTIKGNPKGIPAVFLHGGPGDNITPSFNHQFDLKLYRLLLFDQRGCGKSKPRNHLEKNTTRHLLADMETLREKVMGAEKWLVAGGSWGSALALLYAEKWPARCCGLLLRGVFDLSLDSAVMSQVYPENDAVLDMLVPSKTTREFNAKTTKLLNGKRTATRRKLIHALNRNEPMYVFSKPSKDSFAVQETSALIGTHYESHHFFVPSQAIYKGLHKIKHIPVIMVEGRYDVVTPMTMAYKLSKRLPKAELRVVQAGHSMHDHDMMKTLKKASQDLAPMLLHRN